MFITLTHHNTGANLREPGKRLEPVNRTDAFYR